MRSRWRACNSDGLSGMQDLTNVGYLLSSSCSMLIALSSACTAACSFHQWRDEASAINSGASRIDVTLPVGILIEIFAELDPSTSCCMREPSVAFNCSISTQDGATSDGDSCESGSGSIIAAAACQAASVCSVSIIEALRRRACCRGMQADQLFGQFSAQLSLKFCTKRDLE